MNLRCSERSRLPVGLSVQQSAYRIGVQSRHVVLEYQQESCRLAHTGLIAVKSTYIFETFRPLIEGYLGNATSCNDQLSGKGLMCIFVVAMQNIEIASKKGFQHGTARSSSGEMTMFVRKQTNAA